tara:strand:+ start:545 stop:754 length:210 start_codon:yes stop_codon:yes gene_type:complete
MFDSSSALLSPGGLDATENPRREFLRVIDSADSAAELGVFDHIGGPVKGDAPGSGREIFFHLYLDSVGM